MSATIILESIDPAAGEVCCTPAAGPIAVSAAEAIEYASAFKALGDPTRIQILSLLAGCDEPVCVCEITPRFAVSQPTISHHLRILRDVGFIFAERRGTFMYYQLNRTELAELPDAMRRIIAVPIPD